MRIAVIGGGVSGLAAAVQLVDGARVLGLALDVSVIEAAPRVGGNAWTIREDGFVVEGGPNAYLEKAG